MSQFWRYLIVGGGSFVLEYLLFRGLMWLVPYLWASAVAYLVVFVVNFLANRAWTFGATGALGPQFVRYGLLVLFNLAASTAVLYLLVDRLGVPAAIGKVAVMIMIVSWNFVLYRKVVYR